MTFLKYFLIVPLAVISFSIFSQPNQVERTELEIDNLNEDFTLVPVNQYGFVLYSESDEKPENKETQWSFRKYDTSFKEVWSESIGVNKKFSAIDRYYDPGNALYIMFVKYNSEEYQLIKLDVKTNNLSRIDGMYPKRFNVNLFKVRDNNLYMSGNLKKDIVLAYVDITNPGFKIIPAEFDGTTHVDDIYFDKKTNLTSIIYSNYRKKAYNIFIEFYNKEKQVDELRIESPNDNSPLSGKLTKLKNGDELVIGTYSMKRGNSTGMYISKLNGDKQEFIKFYHFTDFDNFFSYLSEKKQEKIEKKQKKKEAKGTDLDLNYRLLVHDIIERNNENIMIAEAYYPTYRYESYTTSMMVNGVMQQQTRTRRVFDGYLYSHGVIAAFDLQGNKLWDNTFPMLDLKSFTLREFITVNDKKENIELVYASGSSIKSMIINGEEIVQEKIISEVKPENEDEKIKKGWVSKIEHWYDDNYLLWGFQKIKSKEEGKRKVFFFSKLSY